MPFRNTSSKNMYNMRNITGGYFYDLNHKNMKIRC